MAPPVLLRLDGHASTKSCSFSRSHGRPYPIPKIHKATLMKEIDCLVSIGVLKWQPSSKWASPSFIIPQKDHTVRTISDYRELNKRKVIITQRITPFNYLSYSNSWCRREAFYRCHAICIGRARLLYFSFATEQFPHCPLRNHQVLVRNLSSPDTLI
jgi:hypothetical protein